MPNNVPALTDRQKDCLIALQQLVHELGRPPTFKQLAARLDCCASNAHALVDLLVARGVVERHVADIAGGACGLRIVKPIPSADIVPFVSPYLQRPVRSMGQAMRDLLKKAEASAQARAKALGEIMAKPNASTTKTGDMA